VCSEYGASAAAGYPDQSVAYLKPGDEVIKTFRSFFYPKNGLSFLN
jgi:hypothetical protein